AASGPRMAELAGRRAQGLYTTPAKEERLGGVLMPALKKGAEEAGRGVDEIGRVILFNVSWEENHEKAGESIRRWRAVAAPHSFEKEVWDPRELDRVGEGVPMEELEWRWTICTDLDDVLARIDRYISLGFNEIEIRSGSPDEPKFIERFGR